MAYTAITDVTSECICLNNGEQDARSITIDFGADTAPGEWCWNDGTNADLADASTVGDKLVRLGVAGYRKRIRRSTGALVPITGDWDVSEAEDKPGIMWTDGIVVGLCDDQNGTVVVGTEMILSDNVGAVTVRSQEATGASSGTAFRSVTAGVLAADIIDNDVYCIIGIGKAAGRYWGRV